ncbi:FUSC family protein [Streptomyces sp. NPDC004393]|uniref:FUSC family protein n=1 Tax=Streptomyces sp. NPDC004533 TaxID=3154278 RepID=UPI0033BE8C12
MVDIPRRTTQSAARRPRARLGREQLQGMLRPGRFDRHELAYGGALRVAVGVAAPLAAGTATGHLQYGAFASLGALPAGFASLQGVTRTRAVTVVAASAGAAMSTFVGGVLAASAPWLLVPVVALWGYGTGLAVCLGRWTSVAVLQWPVALLIAAGIPLGPSEAALRAGLVLAGGLLQCALVAVSWTLRPGAAERAALAESYRGLSAYARGLAAGRAGPPPPADFVAGDAVADPNPLLPAAVRADHLNLLEQAERIRASLAALAAHTDDDSSGTARLFAADTAQALDGVADALNTGPGDRASPVQTPDGGFTWQEAAGDTGWRWAAEALLCQLRAVNRILGHGPAPKRAVPRDGPASPDRPVPRDTVHWTALTLRANLTAAGETGRHALRLAAVTGLVEFLVQVTGLYEGRWAVLTAFLVLRPDFATTLTRSVHRAVGTAVGAGLGASAAILAHPGDAGLVVGATIAVAAAFALFAVNYLLFSVFLTAFLVILLETFGLPAGSTATARLAQTALGAACAIIAYWVWPTWEGLSAQQKFARMLTSHSRYTAALLRQLSHPEELDPGRLRALQTTARRDRTDAEASMARLAAEPPQPPMTPAVARTLVAVVTRLAQAELALHALVLRHPAAGQEEQPQDPDGRGSLDDLAVALRTTLERLAESLLTLEAPGGLPPLHRIQAPLRNQSQPAGQRTALVVDGLVDATDALTDVVRRLVDDRAARR